MTLGVLKGVCLSHRCSTWHNIVQLLCGYIQKIVCVHGSAFDLCSSQPIFSLILKTWGIFLIWNFLNSKNRGHHSCHISIDKIKLLCSNMYIYMKLITSAFLSTTKWVWALMAPGIWLVEMLVHIWNSIAVSSCRALIT